MQPEAPNQPLPQPSDPQNPVLAGAFQSVAPHPVGPALQPVDPNVLQTMNKPKNSHSGLIVTILLVVALLGSLGFGVWAFMSRQDFKNNSDQISEKAVTLALSEQKALLDAEFAEKEKLPNDTYTGKPEAGSVSFQYPRTWSAHVIEQSTGNPVNGYFHPSFVPATTNQDVAFALRVEVVNQAYAEILKQFEGLSKQGGVSVAPYTVAYVPGSLGSVITGKIIQGKDKVVGTMVVIPIRDKTLKIWTESNSAFGKDFNEAVLASLTYVP